ncbi:MAG: hypothetical protein KUG51_02365 [Urechidicola sp.]|nr:hypothetical protein [Urechidicola sp.]
MKKIKFIPLFLIAVAFIATSCAIDDDDPVIGTTIITKTVSLADSEIIVNASPTPYNLDVFVDQAFGTNALVEFTMNGADGGSTIHFGDTSGKIPVDVSQDGSVITITLTDVSVLNKPDHVDAVIDQGNKTIKIIVLTVPDADPNALQVVMTWDNPAQNDLDLWITDDPPTVGFVTSQSVTPLEDVSFSNAFPDGTYNILPRDWFSADPVVGILVAVVHPDGTVETFSDTIDAGSDFNYFIKFDKVGDMYTMTQVPTEPVF